jgi:hypothetical protein
VAIGVLAIALGALLVVLLLAVMVVYLVSRGRDEVAEDRGEQAGGVSGLALGLAAGGVLLVLLVCGGVFVIFGLSFPVFEDSPPRSSSATAPVPRPEPNGHRPVNRERLVGARLTYIRPPPDLVWDFTAERFTLQVAGEPRDVLDPLLGAGKTATKIEGRWQLSADGTALELSEITGDGRPGLATARVSIGPAGPVRVNLGARQYNLQRDAGR